MNQPDSTAGGSAGSSANAENILLISHLRSGELSGLPVGYAYDTVDNFASAETMLHERTYALILLDDAVFADQTYVTIVELKRLKPETPLLVITENTSSIYQANLVEAGTDDFVHRTLSDVEFANRLRVCIRRGQRNQRDFRRELALYQIMNMTQQLNAQTEPEIFIEKTVRLICSTFSLYGAAIVIPENGIARIYAAGYFRGKQISFAPSIREPSLTDPFMRSMFTGTIEAFTDISRDRFYTPLGILSNARSVLTLPLRQHTDIIGSLVLFGSADQQFDLDDISVFEILAGQLVGSLQNTFFHEAQTQQVQANQVLLNGWQTLLRVSTAAEIATTLCRLIEEIPNVEHALVWLLGDVRDEATVYSNADLAAARDTFGNLLKQSNIGDLDAHIHRDSRLLLQNQLSPTDPLRPLFRALNTRQLLFLPLEDSARLIGGTVISVPGDKQFGLDGVALVSNLLVAAGQALERITLIEALTEKTVRLEAILRSITEGIFFVDDTGHIAFCNPQATELMGIKPAEFLGRQPLVLLDLLSARSENSEQTRSLLYAAVDIINNSKADAKDNYPIVEFKLTGSGQLVRVEFIVIDHVKKWNRSWVGLVQTITPVESIRAPSDTVEFLVNTLSTTGKELANSVDLLINENEKGNRSQRLARLSDVRRAIAAMQQLVQNVAEYSTVRASETGHHYALVDLDQMIKTIIDDCFEDSHPLMTYEGASEKHLVEMDPEIGRRALVRLFQDSLVRSEPNMPVNIHLEVSGTAHSIVVEQTLASARRLGELSPFDVVSHELRLDLLEDVYPFYLLGQFFQARITNQAVAGKTQRLVITLPVTPDEQADEHPDTESGATQDQATGAPLRVPHTLMMIEGGSTLFSNLSGLLEREGYDLLRHCSPQDAIGEVKLTHLDLIVIDGNLPEDDAVTVVERLHRTVDVPIVVVADRAQDDHRVKALNAGAEDYLVAPITDAELLARVKLLFRRKQLRDRTEAPLDLGDLRIDFGRRMVYVNHKPVSLTRIEYDLLNVLVKNMGQVVVHQTLLEQVWGPEYRTETQYLWVHISRLRKKLEPSTYIHNQARIGYIFQSD